MAVNLPIRKQAAECRNAGALYIGWKNTTQLFSRAMRIAGGGVGSCPRMTARTWASGVARRAAKS
jgi:hypothetical protein